MSVKAKPVSASVSEAVRRAKSSGEVRYLVEYDHGEGRRRAVVSESFLQEDEFEAFDGRVVGCASPESGFEWF